jgi:hypothetical protein
VFPLRYKLNYFLHEAGANTANVLSSATTGHGTSLYETLCRFHVSAAIPMWYRTNIKLLHTQASTFTSVQLYTGVFPVMWRKQPPHTTPPLIIPSKAVFISLSLNIHGKSAPRLAFCWGWRINGAQAYNSSPSVVIVYIATSVAIMKIKQLRATAQSVALVTLQQVQRRLSWASAVLASALRKENMPLSALCGCSVDT